MKNFIENLKKKKIRSIGKLIFFFAYESRRSSQSMRFAASGLPVAERGAAEAFHCHFDEIFNATILQDVLLRGVRFENDVVRKYLRFFVPAARNRVALKNEEYIRCFAEFDHPSFLSLSIIDRWWRKIEMREKSDRKYVRKGRDGAIISSQEKYI